MDGVVTGQAGQAAAGQAVEEGAGYRLVPGWGVTRPAGFRAAGLHCGIKRRKPDLGWIVADEPCVAAGVYTQNRVHAPCVDLTRAAIQRA
ncbi:MAG TPA: bifunctional ornithine acetyltransferase/N-acetylglutamate synthase, partial [Thermaerobacter sp.]